MVAFFVLHESFDALATRGVVLGRGWAKRCLFCPNIQHESAWGNLCTRVSLRDHVEAQGRQMWMVAGSKQSTETALGLRDEYMSNDLVSGVKIAWVLHECCTSPVTGHRVVVLW